MLLKGRCYSDAVKVMLILCSKGNAVNYIWKLIIDDYKRML